MIHTLLGGVAIPGWTVDPTGRRDFLFPVPATLSTFTLFCLSSSSVYLSYFNLIVPMHNSSGEHMCMSSTYWMELSFFTLLRSTLFWLGSAIKLIIIMIMMMRRSMIYVQGVDKAGPVWNYQCLFLLLIMPSLCITYFIRDIYIYMYIYIYIYIYLFVLFNVEHIETVSVIQIRKSHFKMKLCGIHSIDCLELFNAISHHMDNFYCNWRILASNSCKISSQM